MVHGACFGAWCWYIVSDLLLKAGHTVSSIDMASAGIDPRDADHISSLQEYNQPLTDFFTALPSTEKVILVGHSAGGLNLSFTMERFPHKIAAAVFVTAFMPLSGTTLSDIIAEILSFIGDFGDSTFYYANGKGNPATSFKLGTQFTRQSLLQNSPPWDLTLWESLVKKFPLWYEPLLYTAKNYGSVRRIYVVSKEDKLLVEAFQRKTIVENPPQMVYEIEGSDHAVFFSKPLQLTEVLIKIANTSV
ncbi:methyl jasmonate esterase 1-like [Cryptomeria japonica]|uniref:methyl jasmonate esterase 1-like n=1 Tax=Cryptomeria japonica TaxID=3369 RepID=UPI0027D9D99B|nr:methyl jasmonate esterase 1-like [Cryptomeria japonica]